MNLKPDILCQCHTNFAKFVKTSNINPNEGELCNLATSNKARIEPMKQS